mgnify:CR=1 FL=1
MTEILTKSIDSFVVVIEQENGIDYVHVKCSDSDRLNKDAHYFPKGDEKGALEVLNQIATLLGVGPVVKDNG